jgi:hypothetical protein
MTILFGGDFHVFEDIAGLAIQDPANFIQGREADCSGPSGSQHRKVLLSDTNGFGELLGFPLPFGQYNIQINDYRHKSHCELILVIDFASLIHDPCNDH